MTESDKERAERVGDPKLQSAYRALGAEEPPRALDEAVLAASRRAAKVHPAPLVAPTGRRSWSVPLAAAAVLALAVGVTVHMQIEQPGIDGLPPAGERDRPEAVARSSPPPAKAEKPAIAAAAPPAAMGETRAKPAPKTEAPSPAREMTAQSAEADQGTRPERELRMAEERAKSSSDRSLAGARDMATEAPAAPAPQAAAPAALAKRADAAGQAAAESPERELERIADLRKQGRHDEADKALAEFRKRHPDIKIPAAMLERVERR